MKPKSIKFAAMTIHEANMRLTFQLYDLYDDREAANIADLVMENITGWKRIDRVINKEAKMSGAMEQQLEDYTKELMTHKPVQYVLHEAWFAGIKFYVDENVLIPRPETEELVDVVIKELRNERKIKILDVGAGSGCIPVTIKKNLPAADVYAVDVSEKALAVAERNAATNNVDVKFILTDILDESKWVELPSFDYIVSNPPYIPSAEISLMQNNVTKFEPHLALFVPDNDPFVFYKAIARFAQEKLPPGGKIFLEMHENFAQGVKGVFSFFSDVLLKKDMHSKERFLIASGADPSLRSG
jgi:release factor glutamine methyltransferase